MYEKQFIREAAVRSASTDVNRRRLLTMLGVAGAGAAAATVLGGATAANAADIDDPTILNFALNLEYLEAEFYHYAYYGQGINPTNTDGTGKRGNTTGGHQVPFKSSVLKRYAKEIAGDELEHVQFLRKNLGSSAVARPAIDFKKAFTAAAKAAGVIKSGTFDVFANEQNFLLGAFLFEDVGVTAYKGAAPLIQNKVYLEAAAGILAVEAYHAGAIRSTLFAEADKHPSLFTTVQKLSNARDLLDGPGDKDQGIRHTSKWANITPTDRQGIAFSRTPGQVLNIVYLNPKSVTSGGFFPNGVNGAVNTSGGAAS